VGEFGEALRLLQRAAQINSSNPRIEPHLSRVRFLLGRSLDPAASEEIRTLEESIAVMHGELDRDPIYSPGVFWKTHGTFHLELLKSYGLANFKRTVSHNYQNWLMTSFADPQVRRLVETWAEHRRLEPFVNTIERPDHVGFHRKMNFDSPEYALGDELEREVYRLAVGLLWEHVLVGDRTGILNTLEEAEIGNPIRIHRHGRLISSDLAHSLRERNLLLEKITLTGDERLTVGEIGAGHGRLAEIFARTTNYRYLIFDIPPALYVSEWYIRRLFPNERIFGFRPFDRWEEVRDEVAASRFAFFTANQIEHIPDRQLDLFINMNSLMEMRMDQIQNFLKHISRLTTRAFLSRQWLKWQNSMDNVTVDRESYSLGSGWRKVLDVVDDVHPDFFNQIWARG
jgi:putative sugar O-methyltransferase